VLPRDAAVTVAMHRARSRTSMSVLTVAVCRSAFE